MPLGKEAMQYEWFVRVSDTGPMKYSRVKGRTSFEWLKDGSYIMSQHTKSSM